MCTYICSALFRNLRFLQKALRFLGIPRKMQRRPERAHARTHAGCCPALAQVGAAISTVPILALTLALALALAHVGAAISTVVHWGTVEMAVPTWARARVLGIPRKRRFLKSSDSMVHFLQKVRHSIEWHAF